MKLIILAGYATAIASMIISACQRQPMPATDIITPMADSFRCEMYAMFGQLEDSIEVTEKKVLAAQVQIRMGRKPPARDSVYLDDFFGDGPGRMVPIRGPQQ